MARSKKLESVLLTDEIGIMRELEYYIQIFDDDVGNTFYGIKIEKTEAGNRISEETCGLTHSYEKAECWVRKLAAGTVTPTSLHDIVDDFVG